MDDQSVTSSIDTAPTDEPAAATPPGRSRLAVAMFVVAGLLLIAAIAFGVLGLQAQSDASDQHDKTAAAAKQRRYLGGQQRQLEGERKDLQDEVLALPDKYQDIESKFRSLADAHDHYVDTINHAIDLYNVGDDTGGAAVVQGDGATGINDVMAKKTASQQAMQAAEDALHHVQEGL